MDFCGKGIQDSIAPVGLLSLRPDLPPRMIPLGLGFLRLASVLVFYGILLASLLAFLYVLSLSIRDGTLLSFIWRPGLVRGLGCKSPRSSG